MRFIRLFYCLFISALLGACTYHSKLPRGIFATAAAEDKVPARVLLASDKIAQKQFILKDYHSSNSVHSYKISLADGSQAAAAEALATLFETVEVNPAKYAPDYAYYAQLTYTVGDTHADSLESVQWFNGQPPVLETRVMLEIYDTQTNRKIFSMFASRQNRVEMTDASAVTQRVEDKGKTLFLPFTAPVYTQQFGDDLRYTLSRDLSQCLMEIADTLQQNRSLFAPLAQNNVK